MAYIPERGDVIWVDFDPTRGLEIQKTRPALVLSPKAFNQRTKLVLVAPVTSTARGHAFEVSIAGNQVSGVVVCQQVRTVDYKARHIKKVERASKSVIDEALAKVRAIVA
ncbi:type II toxin-antitoxin system PemK/MazF family toxin [Salinisphaera sp. G21_0]|uniref:type II toxin-antitoxin system PemK/MazF family toxin n=1 Tax=Salinisphaera sp. G21_0 TaxID=2821094 RepID=UPI001ADA70D0|nr:type II toxin-antitoxin system PemK/MazF family toxin [Salinisphaera sp. G21_0]MBO9483549.1 type II toxin-antitoxin system PemK/MazF family toxin [Salinisphaera sp. G21_0]